ncbi:MAG TPA: hypothetical protein VFL80_12175 [Thermoanaerobaculia bacterium]|nr:hypothetical protein [Thermoanaerobaculia bacterium]
MKSIALAVLVALSLSADADDWRTKVTDAKSIEDPRARRDALLAVLREALPGHRVELSGEMHCDHVHPADNKPAPIVNFDVRLNEKQSAQPRGGGSTRSLQNNFGYYFSVQGVPYVVVGPAALDPRSPILTRLAMEHEMFHAEHHPGDRRSLADRELETWSVMFVRFFPDVHQFKQQWRPMFNYYEEATEPERAAAIKRLAGFYRTSDPTVGAAFDEWLSRRRLDSAASRLLSDLEKELSS